jgi:formylglycine-generating enzyme required for sulfatase activity
MDRVVAVLVLAAACGSSAKDSPTSGSGTGSPPAKPLVDADPDPQEPKRPPPPALVKPGPGDCKTDYAPRPTRDPNPMCKIAGGTFEMGDPKGKHVSVELSPYVIDQFEVTNAQMLLFLETTHADKTCKDCFSFPLDPLPPITKTRDGGYEIKDPQQARWPFDNAYHAGAMLYCAWAGKVLPTDAQWEFAARHDPKTHKDRLFPWGDTFDPKRARCDFSGGDHMATVLPVDVGSYDGAEGRGDGRSPWGLHDMLGNAAEIVADCFKIEPTCTAPCKDPIARTTNECLQRLRGGYVNFKPTTLTAFYSNASFGFRCAVSMQR